MIRRVAFALMVGVLAPRASAQSPPAAPLSTPPVPATARATPRPEPVDVPPPPKPVEVPKPEDQAAKKSITRLAPLPRRMSGPPGRFANPGGVGRYSEYYTASTPTSQVDLHPRPLARFDRGGGPDRAEQIAAFRAGQLRTRNIQDNINVYGRPYGAYGAGFGFGLGLGFGGLYGGGLR